MKENMEIDILDDKRERESLNTLLFLHAARISCLANGSTTQDNTHSLGQSL